MVLSYSCSRHRRRLILESQLGLAVLHVSFERFCNPLTPSKLCTIGVKVSAKPAFCDSGQRSSQALVTRFQSQSLPPAPAPAEQPVSLLDSLREMDVEDSRSDLHKSTEQQHEHMHANKVSGVLV